MVVDVVTVRKLLNVGHALERYARIVSRNSHGTRAWVPTSKRNCCCDGHHNKSHAGYELIILPIRRCECRTKRSTSRCSCNQKAFYVKSFPHVYDRVALDANSMETRLTGPGSRT